MIPDPVAAALARLEAKFDQFAFALRCLVAYETAGSYEDRRALRRRLDEAAAALEPPGRTPVVSDPDAGPPEPMA